MTAAAPPVPRPALTRGEVARKLIHIAAGGVAFLLRFLGPVGAAACAVAALVFNVLVLPRVGGRRLWREAETARGAAAGIVFYPLTVLGLVVVFHRRLEVAAAVWGILALGDGLATLVGIAAGGRRLPWNPTKSWAGTLAYAAGGTVAATALLLWTAPGRYAPGFALAVAAATAVAAAAVESLPLRLDDNLTAPPLAGLLLFCLLLTEGRWEAWVDGAAASRLLAAVAVNAGFAALAYLIRGLDLAGAVTGWLVGAAIWAGLGWQGWILLAAFFAIGTGGTQLGYRRKAAARLAQEGGGRRSARHVVANGGVAAVAAVLAATTRPAPRSSAPRRARSRRPAPSPASRPQLSWPRSGPRAGWSPRRRRWASPSPGCSAASPTACSGRRSRSGGCSTTRR